MPTELNKILVYVKDGYFVQAQFAICVNIVLLLTRTLSGSMNLRGNPWTNHRLTFSFLLQKTLENTFQSKSHSYPQVKIRSFCCMPMLQSFCHTSFQKCSIHPTPLLLPSFTPPIVMYMCFDVLHCINLGLSYFLGCNMSL